ncbi:MAG: ATP-binding cassette domain-containing protein, partial [Vulcanimicrobiaceae bacterium]
MRAIGEVRGVRDGLAVVTIPNACVGDGLWLCTAHGNVPAQILAFDHEIALAAPCGIVHGLQRGDRVLRDDASLEVVVGTTLLGRVINANGEALDEQPLPVGCTAQLYTHAPATNQRVAPSQVCATGVRAIDALLTLARGARIGLFGAPGAGKSTLLQMLARGIDADAIVVAAIGERGREAADWARCVDERTTVIIETSDAAAGSRLRAAWYAVAHAAALCRRGLHVVLVLDSLARVGAAQRELGVAMGEPVGRGGYPASVVPMLARLLEVAGTFAGASMTVIATVLSDGDERDPLSE